MYEKVVELYEENDLVRIEVTNEDDGIITGFSITEEQASRLLIKLKLWDPRQ